MAAQLVIPLAAAVLAAYPLHAGMQTRRFDGNWWMTANYSERYGFIDGFSDCAVWSAHNYAFNTTPEQIIDKITDHYQNNKEDLKQSVIGVWQTQIKTIATAKEPSAGETWNNPHWYLNGGWWRGENQDLHAGYVEGFALCAKTQPLAMKERYSRPADYYTQRIDSYIAAHKNADKSSVASVLQRFQDSKIERQ